MRNYIIIVNWNGWKDTIRCLEGVFRLSGSEFCVLLCDNGSTDGSVDKIKAWAAGDLLPEPLHPMPSDLTQSSLPKPVGLRELTRAESEAILPGDGPELVVIHTGSNLGFAGGNNVGLRYALRDPECEFLWLLNNDTYPYPEALTALIEKAKTDAQIGAVASITYHLSEPEKLEAWAGARVNLWIGYVSNTKTAQRDEWFDSLYGASLLLKSKALRSCGLLDEGFFLYWEETELCLRLRKSGWRLAAAPSSRVLHKIHASIAGQKTVKDRFFTASGLRILKLYSKAPQPAMLLFLSARIAKRLVRFNCSRLGSIWDGIADYQQRLPVSQRIW